ncbi:MAG: Mu transposase C-terminal domain-containing protein [Lachnospiraceae bacterium]|nr:Mu transposase C-terminal domain-containing protein [Lachnospiraceae bacterium]MCM1240999.1 Mu transposase C-terminal domain-containing protein [Lachnospiraceae bacterium]
MGREERLLGYFRRLTQLGQAQTGRGTGKKNRPGDIQGAIQKYGIPGHAHAGRGPAGRACPQKVTRKGIMVNGREYWDEELELRYLGCKVNVVVTPDGIRVEDMDNGSVIATFTCGCP